ncbi:tyrosine-type recombinase/integrase [Rhodococcus hoagii]|nr:tyrosine-type recombinase/integrase [Prescottella equi]
MAGRGAVRKRCGCITIDPDTGRKTQLGSKCPKLKRPSGGWSATHGTWTYTLGITDATGKRRQVSKSGFPTRDDAQAALDKVRAKHTQGIAVVDRPTVAEYLRDWMDMKRPHLKASSVSQYEGLIRRVLVPHLGRLRLDDLRQTHIRGAFDAYLSDPTRTRTRAGGRTTIKRCKAVLRSALGDAMREGLVERNVAALVKLPPAPSSKAVVWSRAHEARWRAEVARLMGEGHTVGQARKLAPRPSGVMVWSPMHLGQFLDHTADHRLYALFFLLGTRGLRRGEVCALQWDDIDHDHSTLTIERQCVMVDGRPMIDTPKSEAGTRTIALGKEGVDVLKAHRRRQAQERLALGVGDTKWMFTDDRGQRLNPTHLAYLFTRLVISADLPPIRTHDIRHTAATLMLASGSNAVTVRDTLGHSDVSLTLGVYSSLLEEVAQASADAVASFIPRKARTAP